MNVLVNARAQFDQLMADLWAQHLQTRSDEPLDRRDIFMVLALVIALLGLFYVDAFGGQSHTRKLVPVLELFMDNAKDWRSGFFSGKENVTHRFGYWTSSILVFYAVIPFLFARFAMRMSPTALGLSPRGFLKNIKAYVLLYLAILLPLLFASTLEGFQKTYPMMRAARNDPALLLQWELIYLPQFLGVEFLFRGFLIFCFERRLGLFAVLLPLVPYGMIHIGKPPAEVFGALVAGLVLGTVAWRTRSLWLGIAIHMSVALTMDLLSFWHHQAG